MYTKHIYVYKTYIYMFTKHIYIHVYNTCLLCIQNIVMYTAQKYVYAYIHTHLCMYIYIYIDLHTYAYTYKHTYAYMFIRSYKYFRVCICVCTPSTCALWRRSPTTQMPRRRAGDFSDVGIRSSLRRLNSAATGASIVVLYFDTYSARVSSIMVPFNMYLNMILVTS